MTPSQLLLYEHCYLVFHLLILFPLFSPIEPKLNYTIIYNATRALKVAQLIFGSPDKPDGRLGNVQLCPLHVLCILLLFCTCTEIQIKLDQVFMQEVLQKDVNILVETQTFPKLFQQQSVESKQVR